MIADFKPYPEYPEYKELGLLWLGPVPKHWDVRQARHIGRLFKGVGGTKEDSIPVGVPCVRYGELYTTHTDVIRTSKAFVSAEHAARYTSIQYGDVLFAASGETIEDIGKSAVNLMRTAAVCGGDIIVLRPTIPVHAPFLGYAMDCRPATNQKAIMGRGTTVKHIYPDELKKLTIPLPPPDEQEAIVRFIRYVDQRVNRLIKAKRRLIAVLNEQKQAIIHRAVTRGLDPAVPLKPSGIDWLGDIPTYWQVHRIASLASSLQTGPFGSQLHSHEYIEGGVPVINPSHMAQGRIASDPGCSVSLERAGQLERHKCAEGDVLFARRGELGRCALVTSADAGCLCGTGSLKMQVLTERVTSAYLVQLMQLTGPREWLSLRSVGSTMENLNTRILANLPLPLPPLAEQATLLEHIGKEMVLVQAVAKKAQSEIDLIREYRTRLVSDVVTGQLDVRGLDLPEAGEEEPVIGLADEDPGDGEGGDEGEVGEGEVGDDEGEGEER